MSYTQTSPEHIEEETQNTNSHSTIKAIRPLFLRKDPTQKPKKSLFFWEGGGG